MHETWRKVLSEELEKPYFKEITERVRDERLRYMVFPPPGQVLAAYEIPFDSVKVVILGQDPYHTPGMAHGLSFSVPKGQLLPPSLRNIFKELQADLGGPYPPHGCLQAWADRGVMLLNTILTVRSGSAGSHSDLGWEKFTDATIRKLSERQLPLVFILWGNYAKGKRYLIEPHHGTIVSAHPSPFAADRGFFGSKPFSRTNALLETFGQTPIDWQLV